MSASSQSLPFILSLRLYSSFITSGQGSCRSDPHHDLSDSVLSEFHFLKLRNHKNVSIYSRLGIRPFSKDPPSHLKKERENLKLEQVEERFVFIDILKIYSTSINA